MMGEGGLLVLLLALLAGLIALVFSVVAVVLKCIGAVCSGVFGMLGIGSRHAGGSGRGARVRVCGHPRCRRSEIRAARYCSRCGHPLA
jgi:hypothetical protein